MSAKLFMKASWFIVHVLLCYLVFPPLSRECNFQFAFKFFRGCQANNLFCLIARLG